MHARFVQTITLIGLMLFTLTHTGAESLEQGKLLFENRCATCHKLPQPSAYTWTQWVDIMVAMSHMAGLDDKERSLILQYLMSTTIASTFEKDSTIVDVKACLY